jgi:hypothetical protein
MNWPIPDLPTRLKLIGVLILLVGLGTAALIYHQAGNVPSGVFGYDDEGSALYPLMPEDTKKYRHDLELYGGKLNVMMDEFRRWFEGLWHGKALAKIIAFLSLVICLGFFYAAKHLIPPEKAAVHPENDHPGAG